MPNQADIIGWLREVTPALARDHEHMEDTLIKFAKTKSLAPALLEKLGAVANTAFTNAHLDHSNDRGASFRLIDVDGMTLRYIADGVKFATEVPEENVGAPIDRYARAIFSDTDPNVVWDKAFSVVSRPVLSDGDHVYKMASISLAQADRQVEIFQDARQVIAASLDAEMEKLASDRYGDPTFSFKKFSAEVWAMYGDLGKQAITALVKHASRNCPGAKWQAADAPVSGRQLLRNSDLHKQAAHIGEMVEQLAILDTHFIPEAAEQAKQATADALKKRADRGRDAEVLLAQRAAAKTDMADAASRVAQGEAAKAVYPDKDTGKAPRRLRDMDSPDPVLRGEVTDKINFPTLPSGILGKSIEAARGAIPKDRFREIMLMDRENHGQRLVDQGVDDARFQSSLEHLLSSDPVLQKHDTNKILQYANSIREINPGAAVNPQIMRYLLREAVQYEGLDPVRVNDLTKMRKDVGDAKAREGEASGKRYAITPLSGGKKS